MSQKLSSTGLVCIAIFIKPTPKFSKQSNDIGDVLK